MKTSISACLTTTLVAVGSLTIVTETGASAAYTDCPSGNICLWSAPQYGGTRKEFSATNAYKSIGLPQVGSYYNNRSKRTWLHQKVDGSGSYVCLNPGAKSGSTSGWQQTAKAVYLATITSC